MGIFTGLNGFLMSSSRLLFSMGRSGIMPTVFSKLHSKYKTPYVAIIFLVGVALVAPWLGRNALNWIVNMCRQQVSLLHTSLLVYQQQNYLVMINKSIRLIYKTFAIIGSIVSFIFLGLLLIPGSPASLPGPSYIALAIWLVIGLIFFFIRYPKLEDG